MAIVVGKERLCLSPLFCGRSRGHDSRVVDLRGLFSHGLRRGRYAGQPMSIEQDWPLGGRVKSNPARLLFEPLY